MPDCSAPENRQFDFWIGEWAPQNVQGVTVGTSSIQLILKSCIIFENWNTPVSAGKSFNLYDVKDGKWHQTWVDNSGMLLLLEGQFNGKSMVLEGKTIDQAAKETKHRITWTPNADGSVRQLWESTDAKGAWTVAFDGLYKRISSP